MKRSLEAGDLIVCSNPACNLEMLECVTVPTPGSLDYTKCFKPLGFKNKRGTKAECPACNRPWAMHDGHTITAIFVKDKGWVL